jgi:hypothetical protein
VSSDFRQALAWHGKPRGERRWVYVPYDQLSGPLAREAPGELGIVLVESACVRCPAIASGLK